MHPAEVITFLVQLILLCSIALLPAEMQIRHELAHPGRKNAILRIGAMGIALITFVSTDVVDRVTAGFMRPGVRVSMKESKPTGEQCGTRTLSVSVSKGRGAISDLRVDVPIYGYIQSTKETNGNNQRRSSASIGPLTGSEFERAQIEIAGMAEEEMTLHFEVKYIPRQGNMQWRIAGEEKERSTFLWLASVFMGQMAGVCADPDNCKCEWKDEKRKRAKVETPLTMTSTLDVARVLFTWSFKGTELSHRQSFHMWTGKEVDNPLVDFERCGTAVEPVCRPEAPACVMPSI